MHVDIPLKGTNQFYGLNIYLKHKHVLPFYPDTGASWARPRLETSRMTDGYIVWLAPNMGTAAKVASTMDTLARITYADIFSQNIQPTDILKAFHR